MASTAEHLVRARPHTDAPAVQPEYSSRSPVQRWLGAVLFAALALVITIVLRPYLAQTIFVFFFGAVALTAWYSGLVPSLAVLLFGLTASNYLLIQPFGALNFDLVTVTSMTALMMVGVLIAWITHSLTTTRAALSHYAEQLQDQALELEAQYEESQMITEELETSHVELAETVERAEAASRAKTDFLAVMSHELRTPLNAIVGYADLLQTGVSGPLTETQKTHLSRIRSSSFHLLDLIQDVLSFSRIEAGREELRIADVEVQQLARDAFAYIEQQCNAKGLSTHLHLPDDRVIMVTDPAKLRQILLNLLNNACKFTDSGYVEMRVRRNGDDVIFEVEDTGPGIAPEHADRIFEPFTQIDQSTTRVKGGAGLGLPVSRRLAHLLGGGLDVARKPGPGSLFTLHLPIRAQLGVTI
jgi:signal transduction histidine kinase